MTFKEKVLAMTGKEIVMNMVEALKNPAIKIDMDTYGDVRNEICYGCAATNLICKISGIKFTPETILSTDKRATAAETEYQFLNSFEIAIDDLRAGNVDLYNIEARRLGIAQLPEDIELPKLRTKTYRENLQAYIDFANTL